MKVNDIKNTITWEEFAEHETTDLSYLDLPAAWSKKQAQEFILELMDVDDHEILIERMDNPRLAVLALALSKMVPEPVGSMVSEGVKFCLAYLSITRYKDNQAAQNKMASIVIGLHIETVKVHNN